MRTGPKGLSAAQHRARGTERADREIVTLYPDHASRPDPEELPPPRGMSRDARVIWKVKIDRYRQRGQKIQGFEDALRQYCELEAELNRCWSKRITPTMAMVNGHRHYASEFFDTPAAQKVSSHGKAVENPFSRNGRPAVG